MTTSDRAKGGGGPKRQRILRALVVAAVAGAIIFGGYVGYLAWTNDSFPAHQKPFSEYASIASAKFNGTEYAFNIVWLRADSLPIFAQITSSSTDAANSPVCDLGLATVQNGQTIFMPFAVTQHLQALNDVDLSVAVRSVSNGSTFTIVYNTANIGAQPGDIAPSDVSCQQPMGVE